MMSCREATRLASDALERKLTRRERAGLAMHLAVCAWCRTYRRQVHALDSLFRQKPPEHTAPAMPPEAKRRLLERLNR